MPRPGNPQNHSTLRSLTICSGLTPKSVAACSSDTSRLAWM